MKYAEKIETISIIASILLIMLWTYTAVSKIAGYEKFLLQMKMTLPPFLQPFNIILGWLVPLVELVIIVMLISDRWRTFGLYFSFLLLLVFEVYLIAMLLSGLELGCSCGGVISRLTWKEHLVFNAAFMLISIAPIIYKHIINKLYNHEYSPQ